MQRDQLIKFTNCTILRDQKIYSEDFWVRSGKIVDPEKIFYQERVEADVVHDCKGALISPGFIDIQINGGFGVDFSYDLEQVAAGVDAVALKLLEHGVTCFCPTMVTSSVDYYHKILPNIKRKKGGIHGACVLGVHLEGPFISIAKKGAHAEESIKPISQGMDTVHQVYGPGLENASIVTLAPEDPGCFGPNGAIKGLTDMGILVSLGHSIASLADGELGVFSKARLITHLFNAMLPFHHRDPGLVGLLASDQNDEIIYFGIIADGVHTHPAALRIAQRTHPKGLVLVSDAVPALGLPDGEHHIGPRKVTVKDGKAFLTGTELLCGSTAALDKCVQIFREATGCSTEYTLEAASLHPALALKLESKGSLAFGFDADFVFLDAETLDVQATWIAGECVYKKSN